MKEAIIICCDDFEGIFLNGVLVHEGDEIDTGTVLEYLGYTVKYLHVDNAKDKEKVYFDGEGLNPDLSEVLEQF